MNELEVAVEAALSREVSASFALCLSFCALVVPGYWFARSVVGLFVTDDRFDERLDDRIRLVVRTTLPAWGVVAGVAEVVGTAGVVPAYALSFAVAWWAIDQERIPLVHLGLHWVVVLGVCGAIWVTVPDTEPILSVVGVVLALAVAGIFLGPLVVWPGLLTALVTAFWAALEGSADQTRIEIAGLVAGVVALAAVGSLWLPLPSAWDRGLRLAARSTVAVVVIFTAGILGHALA